MKKYLVIGVDEDDLRQRYADTFEANSSEEAESRAQLATTFGLLVAGTIEVPNGQELTMAS